MRPRWSTQTKTWAELALLAVVAYLPIVVSSPGRVSADSKQALLIDPGGFLADAAVLWDPGIGAGTVPHQHIGYLWPMGPWFWAFDQLGIPTWVAQRLWLGTLVLLAALGARWLLRGIGVGAGPALVGALVYALTPYQLAFTARMSVILLPWVGLPWLVELTRRAVRIGGWRDPALVGLVVVSVAGVNATSLVLVGLGPALLLVWLAASGLARQVLTVIAKLAAVSLGVSAWWLAGLRVQGSYGMPVLQLTENLTDIARWSQPAEVLRGLGNWFFAGRDRLGYSIDQAPAYLDSRSGLALTIAAPAAGLASLVVLRGRIRLLALAWVTLGTVVAVGAWPIDRTSPYGSAFRWLAEETSVGLALRNSHRVIPVVVLGLALALAVVLERFPPARWRPLACAALGLAAAAMMVPALRTGLLSSNVDRPEALPEHWVQAADLLDGRGTDGSGNPWRVLEVPGSPFAAYRWGNAVEPVLPALMGRPHVAREVLPYGSAATANLLDALDRRIQEGVLETASLAPIARLFAASDVAVRNDLQWERFGVPDPRWLWTALTLPLPHGVVAIDEIGGPVPGPDPGLAPLGERGLVGAEPPAPPAVGVLQIDEALPVLRALRDEAPLVVAGDGDGLVDLAAAGLLHGSGLVHYADALDDASLDRALDRQAWLVVTDTNRRRIQTWFYAIRDVRGPTEQAGETLVEPSGYDQRLEVFPGQTDRSRTVTDQIGARVTATLTGGAARPEDRAIAAFDDDLATSWRIGGPDPTGHRLTIDLDAPLDVTELVVVQPQDGPRDRSIDAIRVRLDDESFVIALDPTSLEPDGQRIEVPASRARRIEIEIAGVTTPPFDPAIANAVGFAEVRVPGLSVAETVVLPPALLQRVGVRAIDHGLDLVLTRLRHDPFDRGRTDTERRLDRTFELPSPRRFALSGTARVAARAPDDRLDELLRPLSGEERAPRASASSRLAGAVDARASAAFDGDPTTGWIAAFGPQEGQWVQLELPAPTELDTITATFAGGAEHSVPRRLLVEIDGAAVVEADVPSALRPDSGPLHVEIRVGPRTGSRVRVVVLEVERRSSPPGDAAPMSTLPVSLLELDLGGPTVPAPVEDLDTGCRDDLVTLDGRPIVVRISGMATDADGLSIDACDELDLAAGRHRLVATPGHDSGLDIDRLVLSSAPGGGPTTVEPRDRSDDDGPRLVEVEAGRTRWRAQLDTDGAPLWLVLAQSHNLGWTATADGRDLGPPQLLGGFANGWLVEPDAAGIVVVELEWTPQRTIWLAIAVSAFSVGLCGGLALGSSPRPVPIELVAGDRLTAARSVGSGSRTSPLAAAAGAAGVALVVWSFSRPSVAALAALVTLAVALVPASTWAIAAAGPLAFVLALALDRPQLGWVALALTLAAAAGHHLDRREPRLSAPDVPRHRAQASRAPRPSGRGTVRRAPDPGS